MSGDENLVISKGNSATVYYTRSGIPGALPKTREDGHSNDSSGSGSLPSQRNRRKRPSPFSVPATDSSGHRSTSHAHRPPDHSRRPPEPLREDPSHQGGEMMADRSHRTSGYSLSTFDRASLWFDATHMHRSGDARSSPLSTGGEVKVETRYKIQAHTIPVGGWDSVATTTAAQVGQAGHRHDPGSSHHRHFLPDLLKSSLHKEHSDHRSAAMTTSSSFEGGKTTKTSSSSSSRATDSLAHVPDITSHVRTVPVPGGQPSSASRFTASTDKAGGSPRSLPDTSQQRPHIMSSGNPLAPGQIPTGGVDLNRNKRKRPSRELPQQPSSKKPSSPDSETGVEEKGPRAHGEGSGAPRGSHGNQPHGNDTMGFVYDPSMPIPVEWQLLAYQNQQKKRARHSATLPPGQNMYFDLSSDFHKDLPTGVITSTGDFLPFMDHFLPNLLLLGVVLNINTCTAILNGRGSVTKKCLQILETWLHRTANPTWKFFCSLLQKFDNFNHVRSLIEEAYDFKSESEDDGRRGPDDNVDQEFRKVIHDVLKNNSVRVQVAKCILLGPPEVGKTQLKRALLGNFEKVLESTNCSTQATPAVELFIDNDGGKEWKTFGGQHLKGFTSMRENLIEKSHHLPTSTDSSATKENLTSNPSQPPVITNESAPSQSTNPSDPSRTRAEFHRLSQALARQIEEAKPECSDSLKFKLMYIIDNGGQPSFLDFHSVTATFPASYFLVYDASKGLDARPEMTFRKTDFRIKDMPPSNYSNYDLLRRSLLTVYHFTHRFTNRSKLIEKLLPDFKPPSAPSTLIIGTNKDTTHQKCGNLDEPRLKRLYQNIPSLEHQVSVYCVDSRKPECKALKDIRSSVSQEDNLCQFHLPLSWFQLYLLSDCVGSDDSLQVHKYSDLYDMCLQENHVKSEREFRVMVIVMDCLGVFSCPDVEVLTSSAPDADISGNILVFIDPNLLFEYVSRILIIPYRELPKEQSPACLCKLQVCGELTKKCLDKLEIPDTLSTLPGFHEKLLEWLVKWGLAAKKDGIDQWFIPSVLPPRPKTASPLISNEYFCKLFTYTFTQKAGENYTFHYLPAGFSPLFVVCLMQSKHFSLFKSNSRCRDSLLLLKESDSKYTFNVHLVDEADCLAVYMSPANQGLCSDASTLKHAGAILADLRDCMTDTNNQLFSTNTDCITLCSACRCGKSTQNQCHLAQIKENQDKSWSSRCLHTDRLQSGCYEKSIESDSDIDSDMAQILNGFASGLASRHDRSQSPCQPQSLRHSPRSPRQGLRSSKQRSRSPRQGSRSLRQGLRSSRQRSRSPRQGSRSPKQRSRSPRQGSRSSKQQSRSQFQA